MSYWSQISLNDETLDWLHDEKVAKAREAKAVSGICKECGLVCDHPQHTVWDDRFDDWSSKCCKGEII